MSSDLESLIAAAKDSNGDDEHDPEGQTIAYERSQQQALIDASLARLAGIEAATRRLKEGRYGRCEVCGVRIPVIRLEARPTTRTCIRHAEPDRP